MLCPSASPNKLGLTGSPTLTTGCPFLDEGVGGLPRRGISHIYGAAGVGKSTLAMQAYLGVARRGYGCFVVDCGGGYNPRRLLQLCGKESLPSSRITLFKPRTFQEQGELIASLHRFLDPTIRLIVIDPVTGLYRRRLTPRTMAALYRELAEHQLPRLVGLARDYDLAVLLVNQVSSWAGEDRPVGGDALSRYAALEMRLERLEAEGPANRWVVVERPKEGMRFHILAELRSSGFHLVKRFDQPEAAAWAKEVLE